MQCNFGTFFSHKGFARWFSAADFARVISLKLQFSDPDKPHAELFSQALDFFRNFVEHDGGTSNSMMDALRQYKGALSSMIQLVYDSCLQKHFIQTPSLIGLTLKQQSSEIDYLRSSHCLNIFVYFALRVFYGVSFYTFNLFTFTCLDEQNESPSQEAHFCCSSCFKLSTNTDL